MSSESASRPANRLSRETSPYLLQHAHNPVDWYPWNEEALRRARQLNRPILLSIGYSACHWCHVMERESFENEQIAALMNEHFVSIKVDREERPDLDEVYMQATLAMNHGQGGWPMTVFLTPEQEPIFAGTYFPPNDRWGRPGFASVLKKVAEYWRQDAQGLRRQAGQLTARLKDSTRIAAPMSVGEPELAAAVAQFAQEFDPRFGGFGTAPKFPPATALSFLLRRYHRTQDPHTLVMVRRTLDAMAAGGMYDHIGGGFARYSTDERWLVPHFEKMLYDNALLARTYVEGYQVTGEIAYRDVATETLDYVLREMTSPEGGFYSATDADSEGVEGKFFVWTPEEIRAAVPDQDDARRFCEYYDITDRGNWEHKSIPNTPRPLEEVARSLKISAEELRRTIGRVKPMVYEARRKRVPPGLDDKILTAWNGMMISAMAEGERVLGESRYLRAAASAADFLLKIMASPNSGLLRTYRDGKAHVNAYLEDYAFLTEGLIDLYEAGGEERYLHEAARLAERILSDFADPEQGGFFTTAWDHEPLIVRSREGPDGATPSGNAVAASALARLSIHFGRDDFREAAANALRACGRQMTQHPRAFAKSLAVLDLLLTEPLELAIVGHPADRAYESLWAEISRPYLPNRVLAHHDVGRHDTRHPLLIGKGLVQHKPALYICRNFSCQTPINDPAAVVAALTHRQRRAGAETASHPKMIEGVRLPGHATAGGTGASAVRFIGNRTLAGNLAHGYTSLGSTGLTTSRLGFGAYRIGTDEPPHREALLLVLRQGCNLIDTSTNYTDGESERLIGSVLAELIQKGDLKREEIIVVSKIGYVQGQNLTRAQSRERAGNPYPEMVKYGEGIWHCLHPEFLADQLSLSLDRLGLETLDICLLHNPEYFLSDATHRREDQSGAYDLASVRDQFYGRLEAAFRYFESQVEAGRLQYYGVSSNTCTAEPGDFEATSLGRMVEAAHAAAASIGSAVHHFRVLQCPMNLLESGAALRPNTGPEEKQTVLELAQAKGLAVLVNRPLNAMPGKTGGMIRLAELPLGAEGAPFDSQCETVAELEQEFQREIAPHIQTSGQGLSPKEYFRWAEEMKRIRSMVQNLEHWEQIESQMIAPHINQVLRALTQHFTDDLGGRWDAWRERYLPELLKLLGALRREATVKSRQRTAALANVIDPLIPESKREESLSRKALWVLTSTPGVTCVLNGMRTKVYVEDSLGVLHWEPLPNSHQIYEAVRAT